MSPVGLSELLAGLPRNEDPDLLVGFATRDDAAAYRLDAATAILATADIITPPVDDPFVFGQIAAANALSDIYAMGGTPLVCLNLIGFPSSKLAAEVLHGIVAGTLNKITEAGAVLGGGHTTEDEEPKCGLSVVGRVHPDRLWTNAGARAGDALLMTKPLGSGVLLNANLGGRVSKAAMDACIASLVTLSRTAAEVLRGFEVHAATDVTGFGVAGHALELAEASDATLRFDLDALPILDEALAMYERGVSTGVNPKNRQLVAGTWRFERELPAWHREILVDPQTSGPLLVALPAGQADDAVAKLRASGVASACRVGTVTATDGGTRLVFA